MSCDRRHDEDGIALIAVLFAVMILLGLAVLFVTTATFQARATGGARDFEATIHAAESATDDIIPDINADTDNYVTKDAGGTEYIYNSAAVDADGEEAWVRNVAAGAADSELLDLADAEGFAFRPRSDTTGAPMDVIYAVGWVPDRATATKTRVLKLQFDTLRYRPKFGFLTGGNVVLGGNAAILGQEGSAHANGNVSPGTAAGSVEVAKNLTASGTVDPSFCANVGGECRSGAARQPIPEISARSFYDLRSQAAAPWYDLCPPGLLLGSATVRAPGSSPCTGEILWDQQDDGGEFLGWKWSRRPGSTEYEWRAQSVGSGVFYVHHGNATINGTRGTGALPLTIITSGDPTDGGVSGHFESNGSVAMEAALVNSAIIVDRDMQQQGSLTVTGFVGIHEQVRVEGTVHLTGSMVSEDLEDQPYSRLRSNLIRGTMSITYDGGLDVPLKGIIRITHWNEL